ncbi:hypothetical protein BPIT_05990 [Candidatus Brocadia pituitae]|nr:hypothetical protein BPIT_05990 [Candidatus Brocadia pituitae]
MDGYFISILLKKFDELIKVVGLVKPVLILSRGEVYPTKKGIVGFDLLKLILLGYYNKTPLFYHPK